MSHHICVYSASVAQNAFVDVAAINDQVLAVVNGHFLPQEDWQLMWAAAMSATIARQRIVSPSNRQVTLPFIRPIIAAVVPTANPNVCWFGDNPFLVKGLEELAIEHFQSGAGAEVATSVLCLQRTFDPIPRGQEYTMRGTGTTTAAANGWTTVTVTWADNLPAGEYMITGLEAIGTTIKAARLIIENQIERPGCLGEAAVGSRLFWESYRTTLGGWGRFRPTRMPIVEVLCNAADTAQEIYLSFVRVR